MNRSSVSAYLVQKGQKNGFHLEEGKSVLIGRGNDVAIQIDDKRCSRHHAEITFLYNKVENSGKFLLCSVSVITKRYAFIYFFRKGKTQSSL